MKAKLLIITMFFSVLLNAAPLHGQISVSFKDVPLTEALATLENESEYSFFYSNMLPDKDARVSIDAKDKSIEFILDRIFSGLAISYEINGHQIVLSEEKKDIDKDTKETTFKASGTVIDSTGEPVIGAGVLIEGAKGGTITDADGNWELIVPSAQTKIRISSLGYKEQIIVAGSAAARKVVLMEDTQMLQETVVVGYGVQKKVNLTGAVAMINSEDMASRPISNLSSGIQGMLPGVTVVSPSGQPGESMTTIRVRGIGTIGNANPLILIDGVEGDLSTLNPEDIESMSVLKDAASSAIYGARAANGVLLVTTKSLSKLAEEPTINFGAYYGIQAPTCLPEMCDAIEFMNLDNEARRNVGTPEAWFETDFEKVKNGTAPNYFANTDWVNEVMKKTAPQFNVSLGINGKAKRLAYMASYRYFDQRGLTAGSTTGDKRHNFRIKLNTTILNRVHFTTNVSYVNSNVTSPVNSLSSGGGAIYTAMRIAPNAPVRYTDGSWAYGGGNTNPVATLTDGGHINTKSENINLHNIIKVDILKGWDATVTYNVSSKNGFVDILKKTITFKNPEDGSTHTTQSPNSLTNRDIRNLQQSLILQSNFDFTFGRHNIGGVVGMSQEWSEYNRFDASRNKLLTEHNPTLNLGDASTMSNDASFASWAIRSGFGRLTYNFAERYLLEVNLRYDLSSRFHKDHRGGLFPSFSGAWRISEEKWMEPTRKYIDNLKIRASWGMLGNQYVGSSNYPYLSVLKSLYSQDDNISLIGAQPTTAYVQSSLANPKLSWETIRMLDLGIDILMFKNRLGFTFDWYNKNTDGILLMLNYPAQIGAKPSEQNAGKVNNRGWEMNIDWKDQIGDFFYSVSANLSDVKNKITDLGGNSPDLSGNQIRQVGYPIDAFYGYIADGLMTGEDFKINDPEHNNYSLPKIPVVLGNTYQPGDIKYKDLNGPEGKPDGRITPEYDKTVIGSNIPRYTYSFRGELGWKGIDFSFMLQGVGKCDGFLTGTARHAFQDMAAYPQKCHLDRFDIKTNPNPKASYPRLTYNTGFNQNTFSTFWLEDASYLRLKNIQLGYTLPKKISSRARMDKLRVYVSADNLLTFTKFFKSYDPETPVSKGGYYPQIKTVVFGIDINFK